MKEQQSLAIWAAFSPLIILIGIELYVRNFEDWGAWGTAPLFLIPACAGIAIGMLGLIDIVKTLAAGQSVSRPMLLTLLAVSPIMWLFIRRFVF